ncbi:cobalamin biosynthesis protein [Trinickia fusca]|uniref:Cobalamin biosynthesis protein CobD n=1 Tax=Trinickia fusca TaxID=2419777 RepID=A0A494XEZ3_9BURK|nr:CobD/CbiB family cobalamin biosynthesis protein [Trinickia fusca]RKP48452.1 cobalamin biosynthesis protein [Trinickia fusca]
MGTLSIAAVCALAFAGVALDRLWGEPRRAHPLVGFGRVAKRLEATMNPDHDAGHADPDDDENGVPARRASSVATRVRGVLAWLVAVAPPVALSAIAVHVLPVALAWALHALLLWFALGARSLADHIAPVEAALIKGDLADARMLTSRVVTRDLSDADEAAVARAAIESALENGNDAVFGALFWFVVAGGPGALAFRLANTLDAMWGYRTPRLRYFGWAAARLDDVANYVPARLTALTYALCGDARTALRCWRMQAPAWDSPNAGPVMASGAGSLNVACGGAARYHGVDEARPMLGAGAPPLARDVGRALTLVKRSLAVWLAVLAVAAAASAFI